MSQPSIRHDFYQTEDQLVLSLYVRNIKEGGCECKVSDDTIDIELTLPDDSKQQLLIYPFGEVEPGKEKIAYKGVKVVITFQKRAMFLWPANEREKSEPCVKRASEVGKIESNSDSKVEKKPKLIYPSSKGKVDWDSLAKQVKEEEEKEKKELGGEEGLNELLKGIYANADDDTKRAMIKSYQQSGGTVLSTNWAEVGKGDVKPQPPKGMEERKWEI
ncbi:putative suppressor of G2 allele of SKP1 [Monocercomonoides exilis]|uniref:putative suppressor of G2 allele of SKP1 n=1 Tax=Monocercomonoides exilis TaxID=2049356 RepID=UPI00355A26CF|nr:putative suppressor of G2 allele of SKP1 [Monocercomonoides exilis]|eukprot:MONOS_8394.1-p1 / transcript=MONOS_8394.1 / gene=MONOS_8394 / organism=Monocercomonoides_exilis_PA203 / gene_product=Sgt1b / transcript_product=Sgt1b / location=Mono_scaffold00315:35031-35820(-) / protein_length=216 / sequence_SO=supercontig / SO=protein_coding / is_pseudo=false